MFLFDRIDFIALVTLWVQSFVAWVFVAILGALRQKEQPSGALKSFYYAFAALSWALTVLSVRFFRAHDAPPDLFWQDGAWPARACYVAYLALKAVFGVLIVRGCYELTSRPTGPALKRLGWLGVGLLGLAPLVEPRIAALLALQAPVMILCAALALRVLRREGSDEQGLRLVRYSLVGLLLTWCVHAVSAMLSDVHQLFGVVLSLNSLLDLAVQLTLGVGLVISTLQDSQRRMRAAEMERERLERELARDEKLRALGALVSGVAHELNNPLTVILGYAQILRDSSSVASTAQIIEEQAVRCRGVVRNLSALAGQSVQAAEDIEARELLERVVRGLAPHERAAGKQMRIGEVGELRLQADRIGLEQVLSNLVSNALDASPPGGTVSIDARRIGASVEFSVADQGPGVPQGQRARLFEPFYTTKRPGKGTGLGLAIAHAIVRGHGGTMSVDDVAGGRGAIFRFVIPAAAHPESVRPVATAPLSSSRKLLVLDDDVAVRSVLRQHAERRGWTVSESDCAESALANRAALAAFDVVLCDLRMPGMGGIGFHDTLQREGSILLSRVVFATGDLASSEAVSFSQRFAGALIQKPFEFDELFAELEAAARRSAESASA